MGDLLSIMVNVIVPIFIVVGISFGIGKIFKPDPRGLSVFLIYLFIPALVFRGTYQSEFTGAEMGQIIVVAVGVALSMMTIALVLARVLGYSQQQRSALALSVIMINAANYGIPLNTFAYGVAGANAAIIYYIMNILPGNILGIYFASSGSASTRQAVLNVLRVPIAYVAVLGVILNSLDVELPVLLQRSFFDLAANAAIPGMLALLGLQLARVQLGPDENGGRLNLRAVMLAAGLRLLVGPMIGAVLALTVGLQGVTLRVAIVESAMPTAVLASALATEFGGDARFTSAVTLVSTLASIVTLTVLLWLLGGVAA